MQRACPRDRAPLVHQTQGRVTIDSCPKCGGAFFDADELARATGDRELGRYLSRVHGKADSSMVCPACGNLMDLDTVADVPIDHCTSCLGVWLDAGERERLLARAPGSLGDGFAEKAKAAEARHYAATPRGGAGGGRFAALGHAFRMFAWKFRRRR